MTLLVLAGFGLLVGWTMARVAHNNFEDPTLGHGIAGLSFIVFVVDLVALLLATIWS